MCAHRCLRVRVASFIRPPECFLGGWGDVPCKLLWGQPQMRRKSAPKLARKSFANSRGWSNLMKRIGLTREPGCQARVSIGCQEARDDWRGGLRGRGQGHAASPRCDLPDEGGGGAVQETVPLLRSLIGCWDPLVWRLVRLRCPAAPFGWQGAGQGRESGSFARICLSGALLPTFERNFPFLQGKPPPLFGKHCKTSLQFGSRGELGVLVVK